MKNETILKHFGEIMDKMTPKNLVYKIRVDKNRIKIPIPKDAKISRKKVDVYINICTGKVTFSCNGEYINTPDYYRNRIVLYQYFKKYDCVGVLSISSPICSSLVCPVYNDVNITSSTLPSIINRLRYPKTLELNTICSFCIITRDKKIIGNTSNYWKPAFDVLDADIYDAKAFDNSSFNSSYVIGYQKAMTSLFGIGFLGGNTYTNFDDVSLLGKFLRSKDPVYKETPKQKKVDELIDIKLPEPKIKFEDKNKAIAVGSKVNKEYSVLRFFRTNALDEIYEISRFYVSKKDLFFCRKNQEGKFCILNNKLSAQNFDAEKVILTSKDAFTGTKFEYFQTIYDELDDSLRSPALYTLAIYNDFERMYKSGYDKICTDYLKLDRKTTWYSYLEDFFGSINKGEKNLNKMLGLNKYQLDKLNKLKKSDNLSYPIMLKEILDSNDLNDIDNKTFDTVLDFLQEIESKTWYMQVYVREALKITTKVYSREVMINMIPTIKKFIDDRSVILVTGLYVDYIRTVNLLGASSTMRPHFKTFDDIKRMHDDAAMAYNVQKDKIENKKFCSHIPKWKEWEWNSDDENFVVACPLLPKDLATEGIELHHCVKSYIQRVAEGITNIMFIRKRDEKNVPFFTVEITNDGSIQQVHGFANRNASTEPGLTEFVKKWAKERKLKLTNFNKVR